MFRFRWSGPPSLKTEASPLPPKACLKGILVRETFACELAGCDCLRVPPWSAAGTHGSQTSISAPPPLPYRPRGMEESSLVCPGGALCPPGGRGQLVCTGGRAFTLLSLRWPRRSGRSKRSEDSPKSESRMVSRAASLSEQGDEWSRAPFSRRTSCLVACQAGICCFCCL